MGSSLNHLKVTVECPMEVSGTVIEKMGKRKGIMMEMKEGSGGYTRLIFEVPTRGLLGYRGEFMVDTRGEGTLYSRVLGFRPYAGEIKKRDEGSMVSMATGKALAFSLNNLQERGLLYVAPSTREYEGYGRRKRHQGDRYGCEPDQGESDE